MLIMDLLFSNVFGLFANFYLLATSCVAETTADSSALHPDLNLACLAPSEVAVDEVKMNKCLMCEHFFYHFLF